MQVRGCFHLGHIWDSIWDRGFIWDSIRDTTRDSTPRYLVKQVRFGTLGVKLEPRVRVRAVPDAKTIWDTWVVGHGAMGPEVSCGTKRRRTTWH